MITTKSDKQIELMRRAGEITGNTLKLLETKVKPGITTLELDKIAEDYIRSQNAIPAFKGYGGFPSTICASVNDVVVHGIPNNVPLKEGDIISVDVGAKYRGFHGDAARTFAVGKISSKKQRLIDVTKECFFEGIKNLKAGSKVGDISARVQKHAESHGYSVVRELVGHGIGKELHEDPAIPNFGKAGTAETLKSGNTICIEPMINMGKRGVFIEEDGWTCRTRDRKISCHYENTILIKEDGVEILTI